MASEIFVLLYSVATLVTVGGQSAAPDVPAYCFEAPTTGVCRASIHSFYYNPKIKACDCYVFLGCNGNENAFTTLTQCMETCGVKASEQKNTAECKEILGNENPLAMIDVLDAMTQQPLARTQQVDQSVTDILNTLESRQQTEQVPNFCFDPPQTGLCRARFTSFYHNAETKTCDCFVYGGCDGNENRFSTLSECMMTCGVPPSRQHNTAKCDEILGTANPLATIEMLNGMTQQSGNQTQQIDQSVSDVPNTLESQQQTEQVPNFCLDPPQTGLCRSRFPSFYYNTETKTCDCFVYGGCDGNDNRFSTLSECMATCAVPPSLQQNTAKCDEILGAANPLATTIDTMKQQPEAQIQPIDQSVSDINNTLEFRQQTEQVPNFCFDPPQTGLCRARFTSFYHNAETKTCDCFVYGGCDGNENRFSTLSECMMTCGVPPSRQHNTAKCDEILGTANPLAKPEVMDALKSMPEPPTQQTEQPTPHTEQTQQVQEPTVPAQEIPEVVQEPSQREETGRVTTNGQASGPTRLRAGSLYVGKPVSVPGLSAFLQG